MKSRDWTAGQTLLSSHRQFLRNEVRAVRRLNWLRLGLRIFFNDWYGRTVLMLAGILLISYLASLAMTYFPSRKAAGLPIAQALRYE